MKEEDTKDVLIRLPVNKILFHRDSQSKHRESFAKLCVNFIFINKKYINSFNPLTEFTLFEYILELLKLIAFQVGQEVSLQELARQLGISKNTVESYLDLLSKVFVIYKIPGFSRNLRKEITKSNRWYFYDNGIIGNFTRLDSRTDGGALWENYLASERIKYQNYTQKNTTNYFWRTYDQQELDWLEEENGNLKGFEFKWNEKRKAKIPTAFGKAYPEATFEVVNKNTYLDFIT